MTLYIVNAVIVIDSSNGKRIMAKYYEHATELTNSVRKQETLEKAIYEKTRKHNSNIYNIFTGWSMN